MPTKRDQSKAATVQRKAATKDSQKILKLSVRLKQRTKDKLQLLADAEEETTSVIARRAILLYLASNKELIDKLSADAIRESADEISGD